jgi:hydrogenase nickel incorporation protein HypB
MINVMAGPGAGKTSTLVRAIEGLREVTGNSGMAVIEGDIASEIDAHAIEALGVRALQINTGGACHLTAAMVSTALDHLDLRQLRLLFIENVGNLVCPAEFDLGENTRVMISSVAEGHDKPFKYPLMFSAVDAVILNKIDLAEHCQFNREAFLGETRRLNPKARIIEMSCRDGSGTGQWLEWIRERAALGGMISGSSGNKS